MPEEQNPTTSPLDQPLTPLERAEAVQALETRLFQQTQLRVQQNPFRFAKAVEGVSESAQDVLTALETSRTLTAIAQAHGLSPAMRITFGPLLWDLATHKNTLTDLPLLLAQRCGVPTEQAQSVAYWMGERVLAGFAADFGDAFVPAIASWKPAAKPLPEPTQTIAPATQEPEPISPKEAAPTLLGGEEVPAPPEPPAPRTESARAASPARVVLERDVPWQAPAAGSAAAPRTVARPTDVSKLLEGNLLVKRDEGQPVGTP